MSQNIVVINQGQRIFTLEPITVDEHYEMADGTKAVRKKVVQERLLKPGQSIEMLNQEEADLLLGYHDIKDAAKIVPANDAKIKALQAEINRLNAANQKLLDAEKEANQPKPEEPKTTEQEAPEQEIKPSKKKGR